jgi:hypothetical protein
MARFFAGECILGLAIAAKLAYVLFISEGNEAQPRKREMTVLHSMIRTPDAFTPNAACHLLNARDEDVIAYWVETSGCVFFIDEETGFKLPGAARICKSKAEAEAHARKELALDA